MIPKIPDEFIYPTREQILYYARKAGWEKQKDGGNKNVIIFNRHTENGHEQMDVYWTTCTIKTSINHPRQGKTQMFRRDVDLELYKKICKNPRAHTSKGYQRR